MKFLKSFGAFWYDFIIGDDWKIAVAVLLALGILLGAMKADVFDDHGLAVFGGLTIVVLFAISLAVDVHAGRPKR